LIRSVLRASAVGLALATSLVGCDPVHGDAVDSLGDEAPGVSPGPRHRPGQPCGTCHDGALGNPKKFSVAGTIYLNRDNLMAAANVGVVLTSANGASYTATTNEVGNFYVDPEEFTPKYPMAVLVMSNRGIVRMSTLVGRETSCATCHHDPAGPTSAGHVFIPADGVTP
jgi:hypothetical protein